MSEPCRDKMGIIPDQRFENETVDVVPLKTFMSPEATPEFRGREGTPETLAERDAEAEASMTASCKPNMATALPCPYTDYEGWIICINRWKQFNDFNDDAPA